MKIFFHEHATSPSGRPAIAGCSPMLRRCGTNLAWRQACRQNPPGSAFSSVGKPAGVRPSHGSVYPSINFVFFVTTIRDSEQPVWASILWRAWEANFVVKIHGFSLSACPNSFPFVLIRAIRVKTRKPLQLQYLQYLQNLQPHFIAKTWNF
jgi:hypothetical protein